MRTEFKIQYKYKDDKDEHYWITIAENTWYDEGEAFKECAAYQKHSTTAVYRVVEVTYKEVEKPKPIELWVVQYRSESTNKRWISYGVHSSSLDSGKEYLTFIRGYHQLNSGLEFRLVHFIGTVVPE